MKYKTDKTLISISLIVIFSVITVLYIKPEQSQLVANSIFNSLTSALTMPVLLFAFVGMIVLICVACSKYGDIILGDGKPEYSTFRWISMMISCGLGSGTIYWAYMEWAYYIETPGLGIAANTIEAFEMAVPYTFFHWGFSAWTLYALLGLPIAYHFHVRKNEGLSLSSVFCAVVNVKTGGIISRIIDILFIFICFGGLSITLGLSTPLICEALSALFGIPSYFGMNIAVILTVSAVYSFSSYIGISRGMARLSDWNIRLVIFFCIAVIVFGPTNFILQNTTNSLGLTLQNFVVMSLFTDPIGGSGFTQSWTVFYWLFWISYAPFTGMFIAKISRGRSIRSVVINTLLSGSAGCFFLFGVMGSFNMQNQLSGTVEVVKMLAEGDANLAIVQTMQTLPMSWIFLLMFSVSSVLFLATTMDSAAFTLANVCMPELKNDEEPPATQKMFWCVMLSLVPLTLILIDANLNTIKTCAVITAAPIFIIMIIILIGWLKWMAEDMNK